MIMRSRILAVCFVILCFGGQLQAESDGRLERLIDALGNHNERIGASRALATLGDRAAPRLTPGPSS